MLEAGVKYEEVEIDLQNKPEWYTAKINNVTFPLNYHLLISAR